jgi:hypothetical protein
VSGQDGRPAPVGDGDLGVQHHGALAQPLQRFEQLGEAARELLVVARQQGQLVRIARHQRAHAVDLEVEHVPPLAQSREVADLTALGEHEVRH